MTKSAINLIRLVLGTNLGGCKTFKKFADLTKVEEAIVYKHRGMKVCF